eukprot:TRINITY_DN16798_c0_g1_i1.p2 TRINITY_DN16798_c0_g1~~TRINITY_DN16798_c0_g1_i1.p2  ORF type:complete len:192 (+),score=72.41 TRINITY_DN16798_c0_g1_i1:58-576(+)
MAPSDKKAEEAAAAAAADEDDSEGGQQIFYVSEKLLEECKANLKEGKDIPADTVKNMANAADLPDEDIMVPIDMRGAKDDEELDLEAMVEKLGPKASAEVFVKCAEYFAENKDKEEERPKNLTVAEWKSLMTDEEDEEEESNEDSEEEDAFVEGEDEADDAEEPPAKKAKTS